MTVVGEKGRPNDFGGIRLFILFFCPSNFGFFFW